MNVVAPMRPTAPSLQWWTDQRMVALVKRTAAKDCNEDEFNQFVSVCRDLGLSPLRKQIYAFVFNKTDPEKRNMALVVGIDGGRSIAARSGNYRPDNSPPEWEISEDAKNPLTNPHGIVSCTVGVYHRPTRNDPFERIVAKVFWDEFAPIVRAADADAYEWVDTDEVYPVGHKKAGEIKRVRRLRPGASANLTERLDPKKEQWTRGGRHKIALCAEMQALRRGWPEDMSRVYVEEETDRAAAIIDGEYTDLTPSEMVVKADADSRLERIGGPALLASFDDAGTLERTPFGQFADRVLGHTAKLEADAVALWMERNRAALQEFWAHHKTDALELKKVLETRSGVASGAASAGDTRAKAAPSQEETTGGGAARRASAGPRVEKLTGLLADRHRDNLLKQIGQLDTVNDLLSFARDAEAEIGRLPDAMAEAVRVEFATRQHTLKGMQR